MRVHAEQSRQREAVDVGVDGRGVVAQCGKGRGKVGGDRRFADASFARCDSEDTGLDAWLVERVLFAFRLETSHQLGELVVAHGTDLDMRLQRGIRI